MLLSIFFPSRNFTFSFLSITNSGLSSLLNIHEQIKEPWIFYKMEPRANFQLSLFNFYVTIKIAHENQVLLTFQILDHLSSFFCHFKTDRAMTTSKVSLERSFIKLQNGHGYSYLLRIAWMWYTNKQVVCFFFCHKYPD